MAVPIFVIALPDSRIDSERLARNNMGAYTISPGVAPKDIPDIIKTNFHVPRSKNQPRKDGLAGAFSAHYLVWKKVATLNEGAVVCESDAQQLRELPPIDELPTDTITLLGGGLQNRACNPTFDKKFFDAIKALRFGLNDFKFTWVNATAYYLPAAKAKELVAIVEGQPKHKFRSPDNWLDQRGHIGAIWFPSCFGDQGDENSNNKNSNVRHMGSDCYLSKQARDAAAKIGIALPPWGAKILEER